MTRDQVIRIVRIHCERQFPRTCAKCKHRYESLREFVAKTVHVGEPTCFDAALDDWEPRVPVGTVAFANCPCGNTIAIGSQGIPLLTMWRLLAWARWTTFRSGQTVGQLLAELRASIDAQVLGDDGQPPSGRTPASEISSAAAVPP